MSNEIMQGWGSIGEEQGSGAGQSQENKLDFLKLPQGDTKIRVLDMVPFSYKEWWSPKGNEGKGCSIPYFGKDDLLEAQNQAFMKKIFDEADANKLKDQARKKFLREQGYAKQPWGKVKEKHVIHVLDRATGEVKLLDKGNGVFKELKKFAMNPEYGDLRNYDVTITVKGSGLETEYSIAPARSNTPLTTQELALYEEKKVDLKKLKTFENMTPEKALQIAKGASYKEVLGNGSESSDSVSEKSDTGMLPKDEAPFDTAPERKDEPVNIEKGEELSAEELENMQF